MTKISNAEKQETTAPRKPDGTMYTQRNNQILVLEVFFNQNSTETFEDKLLRVILAEEMMATC